MLAPVTYKRDLERIYGRIINHQPVNMDTLKEKRHFTKPLWNDMWPNESFKLHSMPSNDAFYESKFDYDIVSAVQRQKLFFYQVSLPHFREEAFLNQSHNRYLQYLYLKSLYPQEFLVPCYDMDIFWHTHQLKPIGMNFNIIS